MISVTAGKKRRFKIDVGICAMRRLRRQNYRYFVSNCKKGRRVIQYFFAASRDVMAMNDGVFYGCFYLEKNA